MVMQVGQTWTKRQGKVLTLFLCENMLAVNICSQTLCENMLAVNICPWTLSVPRSEQFSERETGGKL